MRLVCAVLLFLASAIADGGMTECIHATCRIREPKGGTGTGVVFERSQGGVYILTCAHVVETAQTVTCEFWRDGHQSAPITGHVVLRPQDDTDAVIVGIREEAFEGRLPDVIPLGDESLQIPAGSVITSVGCAKGTWPTAWRGVALGYVGDALHFLPSPMEGRSGSALFDAEGTRVIGIIRARMQEGSDTKGIAVPLKAIYSSLRLRLKKTGAGGIGIGGGIGIFGGCGPRGCGPDGCPTPRSPQQPYQPRPLVPVQPDGPGRGAWPTLPPPTFGAQPAPQPVIPPTLPATPQPVPGPTEDPRVASLQADLAQAKEVLSLLPKRLEDLERFAHSLTAQLEAIRLVPNAAAAEVQRVAAGLAELRERIGAHSQALADQAATVGKIAAGDSKAAPEITATSIGSASMWAGLVAALGWTGPPAAAAVLAANLLTRVARRRIVERLEASGSSPDPPPPGRPAPPPIVVRDEGLPGQHEVVYDRRYVPVPANPEQLEALNWALDDHAQRHPGALGTIEAIRAGASQYLSGKRRKP